MLRKKVLALCLGMSFTFLLGCDGAEEREAKYLNKAQTYFDEGNDEKMQVELKNVLQINPKNIKARYLMALAAEKNLDWRKMFANLSAVIEAKPDHYAAQIKLGKLMLFSNDKDKASEKAELVLAVQPNNSDALLLKAIIYLANKQVAEAKVMLEQALNAEAGHYDASLLMIKLLGDEKKLEEAKAVLDTALQAHSDKLKLHLVKINILLLEGKKDEAEALYEPLLIQFPENEKLHYNLAKLYLMREKIDQAEKVLKDLVIQLPEKDQPKFVLIDFLSKQRGSDQAEKELDILISENPDKFGFRFAKLTLYKDQPEKALQILEGIVEDDKLGASGIDARNRLALFYNAKGEPEQARKFVEEVIELDARNVQALLLRAALLMKDGEFDAALADARTVLRDNPESEKALMILAMAQLKNNNVGLAAESLEKVLQINPKNLLAAKELVRLKVQAKDEMGAIRLLEKTRPLVKQNQDMSIMLIDLYGKHQEWDKAETLVKELLEQSENKELPHYKLAQLYMGQQKFEEAIAEFEIIRETKPVAPDVLSGMVSSYVALKQEKKAEKLLDNVLLDHKDNVVFITMRAALHRQRNQLSEAEALFKQVIKLKPKVEIGYKNLASIYIIKKQLNKVIDTYQQALKEIPKSPYFFMQLGVLNTVSGDIGKAIEAYEALLKIDSKNLLAINNLAALLVEIPDKNAINRAYALIEPLKDSKYIAFLDTYGWVNYKKGNADIALTTLESVITKKGVIPEMHYHLAMVYIDKDRNEEAKAELEKAVAGDAKYKGLDEAKNTLESLNKVDK